MRPWLSTSEAMEFTGLSRHALGVVAASNPEVLIPRPSDNCHRRWRAVMLAKVVHGLSEPAAIEFVNGRAAS